MITLMPGRRTPGSGPAPICAAATTAPPPTLAPAARPRSAVALDAVLALPVAGSLTGNARTGRFAWVENRGGARNLWLADAQHSRPITERTGDDGVYLSDPVFDASGSRLAYVEGGDPHFPDQTPPNAALEPRLPPQTVRLVTLDASGRPTGNRAVGQGHGPVFSPDGSHIAFSAQGTLFLAATDGDAPAQPLITTPGTIESLRWSPDGATLAFSLNRHDHSFVALVDVAGMSLRFLDPQLGDDLDPAFAPDGKRIAFIRSIDPPYGTPPEAGRFWSLVVADVATGATRTLWSAPEGAGSRYYGTRSRNLYWSADNRLIFPWERDGWVHAYALSVDRPEAPRLLTPGAAEVETFVPAPDGRSIVFAGNFGDIDRRHLWQVPTSGGPARALTAGTGIESFPTFAGDRLAAIATDARTPATPKLVTARGLAPMPERPAEPPAATRAFVTPEAALFRAADGVALHGQIFRPAPGTGAADGRHPALIFLHGGPRRQMLLGYHPSDYYSNAYALNQYLAARGYVVLALNYRSGTGYGSAFRAAPDTGRDGASEYRDILAAAHYLRGRADVDPARVGLWGGSWGGYLTALGLARNSDLFAAGVDLHGVHGMVRAAAPGLSPEAEAAFRQSSWDSSPIAAIDRWRSPVLVIHGDDDRNVDFAQSVLLERMLTAHGVPHESLAFPNERHEFVRQASWKTAFHALDAFFDRHLPTGATGR